MTQEREKILTIDDIQTILRIGRNQAYKLVAEKKIKAFRTGQRWKITEKALEEKCYHLLK